MEEARAAVHKLLGLEPTLTVRGFIAGYPGRDSVLPTATQNVVEAHDTPRMSGWGPGGAIGAMLHERPFQNSENEPGF